MRLKNTMVGIKRVKETRSSVPDAGLPAARLPRPVATPEQSQGQSSYCIHFLKEEERPRERTHPPLMCSQEVPAPEPTQPQLCSEVFTGSKLPTSPKSELCTLAPESLSPLWTRHGGAPFTSRTSPVNPECLGKAGFSTTM